MRQSAVALDYPTTGRRVAEVPTVVTKSQPAGGALSTPSPTGNQQSTLHLLMAIDPLTPTRHQRNGRLKPTPARRVVADKERNTINNNKSQSAFIAISKLLLT